MKSIAVLLFLAVICTCSVNADVCGDINNCKACHANTECQWCASKLSVSVPLMRVNEVAYTLGACAAKSTSCSAVKFGTVDKLSLNLSFLGSFTFSVEALPNNEWCTTGAMPKEVTAKTCAECTALGDKYGWCEGGLSAAFGFIKRKGGVCLRKAAGWACTTDIIPKLPSPFNAVTITAKYANDANQCSMNNLPGPPLPNSSCNNNRSCDTCNRSSGGCTWCGGIFEGAMMGMNLKANMLGVCLDSGANCDDVKFGTLAHYINKIPSTKKVQKTSFKIENITSGEFCTAVLWPRLAASPDCTECVKNANAGWCELDVVSRPGAEKADTLFLEPAAAPQKGQPIKVKGGVCMDKEINFLCTITLSETEYDVKSTWHLDNCPAA